ncbi:glycosyltransferase family 9 protein [Bizionia paragorgiae]|uniref:ADP-heptose:LPS heptosyltransferase n=1 Tax=Bizionia paragorgiae TaxID=283786 RepID=A0A1H3W0R0_BIZPA|nr:glycosyltransferase family 9 protein [Bizionia paragorgiae]MDX1270953.1 glycosyltransferase family 9 protein [Bizionia paragorgiae]SDZ80647.1 ADP-heptose:LPS heptosyltransferase [Bizionia paragorgiae]
MSKPPKHILVIRLSAMGDVAMAVPVLRAFSQQHPNVKLTVLTRAFFEPFFADLSQVTVYAPQLKGKHKGVFGMYALSKELKALGIDAVADLHNVLRSKLLKWFLKGLPFKQINKGRKEKAELVKGVRVKQLKTTHERYADVFRALGFDLNLSHPTFPKTKDLSANALKIMGNDTNKWIGIAPFAQYDSKMYPLDLMEEVIANLSTKHTVLLFGGGKREEAILNDLAKKYNQVINIAGQLAFTEELELISNVDVMLAMDSGNAHIAAMLGKKVVTIWNVTHPFAGFAPFNQLESNSLLANRDEFPLIPTSIYGNKFPEGYEKAARTIPPKVVIDKIESVL